MSIKRKILALSALLVAVLGALAACSPVRLVNALTPTSGLTKAADIAYLPGNNLRQQLDVYRPANGGDATKPRPVVVFFYGGAWQEGSRDDYLFVAEALTQRGYVVVIPDYRVYPEVKYPEFLKDGAAAVAWTTANIERFGGDRTQVFLMGHSSGAHIAAMLALDHSYLAAQKVPLTSIKGLIGLAGPYDFLPLTEPNVIALFSTEKNLNLTQPISYVKSDAATSIPPVLLLQGDADTRVYPKNSINLTRELRATGAKVEFDLLPGIDHTSIMAKFTRVLRGDGKLVDRVDQFIRDHAA
ncbi:MAG: alpha/beta hydrolase [Casimicrobium sp.]